MTPRTRTVEPTPALKALLDLPLRYPVSPELSEEIEALERKARSLPPEASWRPIYQAAIELASKAEVSVDEKISGLQDQLLNLPDPGKIRQEVGAGPRREAERARVDLRNQHQTITREWTDRGKRQQEQVLEQCLDAVESQLVLKESPTDRGLSLAVDPTWWAQYQGFVMRCTQVWTDRVLEGLDQDLHARTAWLATLPQGQGVPVRSPGPPGFQTDSEGLRRAPAPQRAEIPSLGGALMNFVRTNLLSVSMFSMVLIAPAALVGPMMGTDAPNMQTMRAGLMIAALPIISIAGVFAARRQRVKLREKAVEDARKAAISHLKQQLKQGLDQHRGALDRWAQGRAEQWGRAADDWFREQVEPTLQEAEKGAEETIKGYKRQASQIQEKQSKLKQMKNQISGNLLFDLRRRERDLRMQD